MLLLRQDRMPADSLPEMRACGVGGIVAVQARGSLAETDFLLQLAAQEPRILGVVGWADLSAEGLGKQLEQWVGQTALKLSLIHISEPTRPY